MSAAQVVQTLVSTPIPLHLHRGTTSLGWPSRLSEIDRAGCSMGQYRKNTLIYAQGEVADAVFVIVEGWIKVSVVSPQGKQAVVAVMGAGDIIGECCLIDQPYRTCSATAVDKATLFRMQKQDLRQILQHDASFAESFFRHLLGQKERMERALVNQLFNSSEKRLASILLGLTPPGSDRIPRMNQETLAAMVGTTRSRISFFMNKLKRDGLIRYESGIWLDQKRLSALVEEY